MFSPIFWWPLQQWLQVLAGVCAVLGSHSGSSVPTSSVLVVGNSECQVKPFMFLFVSAALVG